MVETNNIYNMCIFILFNKGDLKIFKQIFKIDKVEPSPIISFLIA